MGQFCSLLLALVLLCFASNDFVQSTMFTVVNMCNYTVWPGVRTDKETFSSTGFTLAAGESRTLRAPVGWKGRFWGRTGCKFDDKGRGNCSTGDCGSDQIECNGAGSTPPATLVEFKLNWSNGEDFYDVSLVDGYAKKIIYLFILFCLVLFSYLCSLIHGKFAALRVCMWWNWAFSTWSKFSDQLIHSLFPHHLTLVSDQ